MNKNNKESKFWLIIEMSTSYLPTSLVLGQACKNSTAGESKRMVNEKESDVEGMLLLELEEQIRLTASSQVQCRKEDCLGALITEGDSAPSLLQIYSSFNFFSFLVCSV